MRPPSCRLGWARLLAIGVSAASFVIAGRARAEPLTEDERARLDRGELVQRVVALELEQGRYVGGVSYVVIHAPQREVMRALTDVAAYRSIFPLAIDAREVGRRGADSVVTLRHRTKLGTADYACRIRRESGRLVRFWLDPAFPHDVEDLWGYFRVEPFGQGASLLTYAALMRLELGLVRFLFEDKIRDYALGTPRLVRLYVEGRGAAASEAEQER